MTPTHIHIGDVAYNAATQSFEALVSVGADGSSRKYACAIDAPIDMSFERAAAGLKKQALRRYESRRGMFSELRHQTPARRATRERSGAGQWLARLGLASGRDAA